MTISADQVPQQFSQNSLAYIQANATQINQVAAQLGISAAAIADSIAREMTRTDVVGLWDTLKHEGAVAVVDFTNTISSDAVAKNYKKITDDINGNPAENIVADPNAFNHPDYKTRFTNVDLNDIGPAHIQIRTALDEVTAYNAEYPSTDPLNLKQYVGNDSLLVSSLQATSNNPTIAIAGLVIQQGQNWFISHFGAPAWNALNANQQNALLVQFFTTGEQAMNARGATTLAAFLSNQQVNYPALYALNGDNPQLINAALTNQLVTTNSTDANGTVTTTTITTNDILTTVTATSGNTITTTTADNGVVTQIETNQTLPTGAKTDTVTNYAGGNNVTSVIVTNTSADGTDIVSTQYTNANAIGGGFDDPLLVPVKSIEQVTAANGAITTTTEKYDTSGNLVSEDTATTPAAGGNSISDLEQNITAGTSETILETYNATNTVQQFKGYTGLNAGGTLEYTETDTTQVSNGSTAVTISGSGDVCDADDATISITSAGQDTFTGSGNTITDSTGTGITFILGTNDGSDTIKGLSPLFLRNDTVQFADPGVNGYNISVSGNVLTYAGSSTVTLAGAYGSWAHLEFADGSVINQLSTVQNWMSHKVNDANATQANTMVVDTSSGETLQSSTGGGDLIFGGSGSNTLTDASTNNSSFYQTALFAGSGNDTLVASAYASDYLSGGTGNDIFDISVDTSSYSTNHILNAGSGNDTFNGDIGSFTGSHTMVYVFENGSSQDTINDTRDAAIFKFGPGVTAFPFPANDNAFLVFDLAYHN